MTTLHFELTVVHHTKHTLNALNCSRRQPLQDWIEAAQSEGKAAAPSQSQSHIFSNRSHFLGLTSWSDAHAAAPEAPEAAPAAAVAPKKQDLGWCFGQRGSTEEKRQGFNNDGRRNYINLPPPSSLFLTCCDALQIGPHLSSYRWDSTEVDNVFSSISCRFFHRHFCLTSGDFFLAMTTFFSWVEYYSVCLNQVKMPKLLHNV